MAHRLHIPVIGEELQLAETWTFTLWEEHRNIKLIKLVDPSYDGHGWAMRGQEKKWTVTLPPKFDLKVARIYIRNGLPQFDSITFTSHYNGKSVRFWVKLEDVNRMVVVEEDERVE